MALVGTVQDLLAEDAWMMTYLSGQRLDCLGPMLAQQMRARAWSPRAASSGIKSDYYTQDTLQAASISDVRVRLFKYRFRTQLPAGSLTDMNNFQLGHSGISALTVHQVVAACLQDELEAYGWPSPGRNALAILARHMLDDTNMHLMHEGMMAMVDYSLPLGKQIEETESTGLPIPDQSLENCAAACVQLKCRSDPEVGSQQLHGQANNSQAATGIRSPGDASAAHVPQNVHLAPESVNKIVGVMGLDECMTPHLSPSILSPAAESSASCQLQPLCAVGRAAPAPPGPAAQQHPRQALKASSAASKLKTGWLPASTSAPRNRAAIPAPASASSNAAECSAAASRSTSSAASDAILPSPSIAKRLPPTAGSLKASSGGAPASAGSPCTQPPAPMLEDLKAVMRKQEDRERTALGKFM